MISHEKKFIFVHIPRTGGTHLSEFLLPYCDEESLIFSPYACNAKNNSLLHAPILDYMDHYGDEILDYTIFTIIRNPWSRTISQSIKHNNGKFEREHFRKVVFSPWTLGVSRHSHFNYLFNRKGVEAVRKGRSRFNYSEDYTCQYAPAATLETMELVYEQITWPYFLQFEDYTKDVTYMLDRLDIKYDIEKLKKKTNSSVHRHYSTYFKEDEIEEIRLCCALDIQFFRYNFEKENI